MAFNITNFKSTALRDGGARPTLFEVTMPTPFTNAQTDPQIYSFFIEAAQLPSWNLGLIQVPYFGRIVKLAGDRTFEPWTVTVINDEGFTVRKMLERWSENINGIESNLRKANSAATLENYKTDGITVKQFSKKGGEPIRQYEFYGMFPQVVGAIDLSWEAMDQIERYQVTFEYDYFKETTPGSLAATFTDNRDVG